MAKKQKVKYSTGDVYNFNGDVYFACSVECANRHIQNQKSDAEIAKLNAERAKFKVKKWIILLDVIARLMTAVGNILKSVFP